MTRRELYTKVKELGAANAIKVRFGDNYTRISNAELEAFLDGFAKKSVAKKSVKKSTKKEAAPKKENKKSDTCPCKSAMIALLSTLQAKRALTAKEAEEVAALL